MSVSINQEFDRLCVKNIEVAKKSSNIYNLFYELVIVFIGLIMHPFKTPVLSTRIYTIKCRLKR